MHRKLDIGLCNFIASKVNSGIHSNQSTVRNVSNPSKHEVMRCGLLCSISPELNIVQKLRFSAIFDTLTKFFYIRALKSFQGLNTNLTLTYYAKSYKETVLGSAQPASMSDYFCSSVCPSKLEE